jgi:hypothetical protein
MKATFGVFALAVFLISIAQPAFAAGCGGNAGRYTPTTSTTTAPATTAPAQPSGGAAPAGTRR